MLKPVFAAVALALLTGCQAPVAPAVPAAASAPAASTASLKAPRLVNAQAVRHVLATGVGATIWGASYWGTHISDCGKRYCTETWSEQFPFTGRGTYQKAGHMRAVYQVPEDQVLVINQMSGTGLIALNGYPISVTQTDINYVFGPGELVVLTFSPGALPGGSSNGYSATTYAPVRVSGYTTDPALLSQLGGSLVK